MPCATGECVCECVSVFVVPGDDREVGEGGAEDPGHQEDPQRRGSCRR